VIRRFGRANRGLPRVDQFFKLGRVLDRGLAGAKRSVLRGRRGIHGTLRFAPANQDPAQLDELIDPGRIALAD